MHQYFYRKSFGRDAAIATCLAAMAITLAGCENYKSKDIKESVEAEAEQNATPMAAVAGDVLVIGGATVVNIMVSGTNFKTTDTAEIFSVATKTFAKTGALATSRGGIQAVAFGSGPLIHRVLVPGGISGTGSFSAIDGTFDINGNAQKTAELFKASAFSNTGAMAGGRLFYTATLLNDGTVLIAGGYRGTTPLRTAEIYNPATKTFTPTGAMKIARGLHSATLLADGKVL